MRSTRAVILAAGFGNRLMPKTAERPKAMVDLAGTPMLARQLSVLRKAAVTDVTLLGGYKADRLRSLGAPVIVNDRYETTNMVASLLCGRDLLDGVHDVLVAYGDIVYEPKVLAAVLNADGDLVVAADRNWRSLWEARMEDIADDVESFRLGENGSIKELGRKPNDLAEVEGQYIGLMKIPAHRQAALLEAYDRLDRSATYDGQSFDQMYMTSFIQHLADAGWRVTPAWTEGGWVEVDTLGDLVRYEEMWAAGTLDRLCRLELTPETSMLREMRAAAISALGTPVGEDAELLEFLARANGKDLLDPADLASLDRWARRVEISGRLPGTQAAADALLATFLVAFAQTRDYRHLNTVLKAVGGTLKSPRPGAGELLEGWCREAVEGSCAR